MTNNEFLQYQEQQRQQEGNRVAAFYQWLYFHPDNKKEDTNEN